MKTPYSSRYWLRRAAAVAAACVSGAAAAAPACPPVPDDLLLPDGFCANVVAEGVGPARHMVVLDDGRIYIALRSTHEGGSIIGLQDTNGDHVADRHVRFHDTGGTGLEAHDGYLYFGEPQQILRFALAETELRPAAGPEVVVGGFPMQSSHAAKSIAIDPQGWLYVNVGAPSNACQRQARTPGSPGLDPCPQLEQHAGIWRFPLDTVNQKFGGEPFATGIRNAVAMAWHAAASALFAVQHGRDQLHQLWPDHFSEAESAELPAEELLLVQENSNFGWPYCYYDHHQQLKVLAPEYGGNGETIGRCAQYDDPLVAFPGHWAPNDMLFYTGTQFPANYRNGAFIAFHGSWNRAPLPQQGYKVAFVPYDGQKLTTDWTMFADHFAGEGPISSSGAARYRPMGLAQGPDGSLYVVDSQQGRLWRIYYPAPPATP